MKMSLVYILVVCLMVSYSYAEGLLPKAMVSGLSSEHFADRESAQAGLLEWSQRHHKIATAGLLILSKKDKDPEVRKRSVEILKSLAEEDYLSDGQGYLGVRIQDELIQAGDGHEGRVGIRILDVLHGSPAEIADLRRGDLILSLDGKAWEGADAEAEFIASISAKKPLDHASLMVKRGDLAPIEITVKLGKRPTPDLWVAGADLKLLDQQARDRHFKGWLKQQQAE
jgi:predicted metalloprotease with PDZ domain